jgi:hypothetical protein
MTSTTLVTASDVITTFSTATVPVPTLSPAGWVFATAEKADFLISHFFEADYIQSYLYAGRISNIQWLIEQYGNDITNFSNQLRRTLDTYLGRYYQVVNIVITTDDNATNLTDKVSVGIQCDVTENGTTYSIGRLLNIQNSIVETIVKLNNTGSAT